MTAFYFVCDICMKSYRFHTIKNYRNGKNQIKEFIELEKYNSNNRWDISSIYSRVKRKRTTGTDSLADNVKKLITTVETEEVKNFKNRKLLAQEMNYQPQ